MILKTFKFNKSLCLFLFCCLNPKKTKIWLKKWNKLRDKIERFVWLLTSCCCCSSSGGQSQRWCQTFQDSPTLARPTLTKPSLDHKAADYRYNCFNLSGLTSSGKRSWLFRWEKSNCQLFLKFLSIFKKFNTKICQIKSKVKKN